MRYAVVAQAVRDYRQLLRGKIKPTSNCNIPELERFFRGKWFKALFDLDGEYLIQIIRKQVEEDKQNE